MKKFILFLLICIGSLQASAAGFVSKREQLFAKAKSAILNAHTYLSTSAETYTLKGFEAHLGRKLNIWERKAFKQLNRVDSSPESEAAMIRNKRLATWSMILGIAGIGVLFIPAIGALSLLFLPAAIITGIIATSRASEFKNKEGSGYGKAVTGIVLGSVGLALIAIVIIALMAWGW